MAHSLSEHKADRQLTDDSQAKSSDRTTWHVSTAESISGETLAEISLR